MRGFRSLDLVKELLLLFLGSDVNIECLTNVISLEVVIFNEIKVVLDCCDIRTSVSHSWEARSIKDLFVSGLVRRFHDSDKFGPGIEADDGPGTLKTRGSAESGRFSGPL